MRVGIAACSLVVAVACVHAPASQPLVAAGATGASGSASPSSSPASPASPLGAPSAASSGAPVTAVPGTGPCETIQDCGACTARPDCRLCTYLRGCMSKAAIDSGACLESWLDSPAQCDKDPVVLRADERAGDAEQRRKYIVAQTQGMAAAGPPYVTSLERLGKFEIPVGPGLCHVLVWSLAADAKPGNVRVSLDFVTQRSDSGGLTGFDTSTRMGSTGLVCSSQAGMERFRVVDAYTYAQLQAGGTGGISFVLFSRPRAAGDPDDVGSSAAAAAGPPSGGGGGGGPRGGGRGDYIDCIFPCEQDKTACENDCFRTDASGTTLRGLCDRTCEQIFRSCQRGCE